MRTFLVLVAVVSATAGQVYASQTDVELDYRLRPNRDLMADSVAEAITTMRVLEDRGIVAKSSGRLSARPTTIQITSTQTFRYITGGVQTDGSFPVEMHYVDKTTHLKGPDGQRQLLPEKTPIKGLRVVATVEPSGKVRDGSVSLSGLEPSIAESLQQTMASVLTQAASIEPILLTYGQTVPQEMAMRVPLPGLEVIDLKMRILNRLLVIEGGVARIEQVYSMDFGTPAGAMKMTAEGSGGGTMLYEVSTQTLLSSDTRSLMKLTLDTEEGVIEIQLNSKQSQKTRPTQAPTR